MRGTILGIAVLVCACGKNDSDPTAKPVVQSTPDAKAASQPDAAPFIAERWLKEKAKCEAGDGSGCEMWGSALVEGLDGTPRDVAAGQRILIKACEAMKYADACGSLAIYARDGAFGSGPDLAAAAGYWESACVLGDNGGCVILAGYLEKGKGVPVDLARAQTLLEDACSRNDQSACYSMTQHLEKKIFQARGKGTLKFYRKRACDLDVKDLCDEN
jgi:TPR repeat protein